MLTIFTAKIQARTCRDDAPLTNTNLKMNTNSLLRAEIFGPAFTEENGEQAKGKGSVIEVLKVWIPLDPENSASEQKEDGKTNADVSLSRMSLCFCPAKEAVVD